MRVAVIPARGGSKRVPAKNIKLFAGRPIISFPIAAALGSELFDRVIVSTDSHEIAKIARQHGAEVPFMRPAALADDFTGTAEVLAHAVQWLKENGGCDQFCCLYPTASFVTAKYLRAGLRTLELPGTDAVVSIAEFVHPIERALRVSADKRIEMVNSRFSTTRSQDLPQHYHDAGQFYWFNADAFLRQPSLLPENARFVLLPQNLVHDINTHEDWQVAETQFRHLSTIIEHTGERVHDLPPVSSPIILGTAQLGMDYGLLNDAGRPSNEAAAEMLVAAWRTGVRIFDTAQAYGASEDILGEFFGDAPGFAGARIITKLSAKVDVKDSAAIRAAILQSIHRLKTRSLWAVLLHDERHLDEWNGTLGSTLVRLVDEGLISNLGASVYETQYAHKALKNPDITMLQIPANVYDRRMERAGISRIADDENKTLIIRSVFLQGVVLMLPDDTSATLPEATSAAEALSRFCKAHRVDRREFAFGYIREMFPRAFIVLGADSAKQVRENGELLAQRRVGRDLASRWNQQWPTDIPQVYDPRRWKVGPSAVARRVFNKIREYLQY